MSEKKIKSVNIWQSYKQERGWLMHFARLANTLLKDEESARDNHVFACNFAKYTPISKFFLDSQTQSNRPFLIWLLTAPPHLRYAVRYAATLPCNLSIMACFADMNVSQASGAKYSRRGGIFNIYLTHVYQGIFQ